MEETKTKDIYEEKLSQKTQTLEGCQEEHSLTSCLTCKELLECQTRDEYVKAVYESMSRGQEGGFEF